MTTSGDDIVCHTQVAPCDEISVNLTKIERFLVTLANIFKTDRAPTDLRSHRSLSLRYPIPTGRLYLKLWIVPAGLQDLSIRSNSRPRCDRNPLLHIKSNKSLYSRSNLWWLEDNLLMPSRDFVEESIKTIMSWRWLHSKWTVFSAPKKQCTRSYKNIPRYPDFSVSEAKTLSGIIGSLEINFNRVKYNQIYWFCTDRDYDPEEFQSNIIPLTVMSNKSDVVEDMNITIPNQSIRHILKASEVHCVHSLRNRAISAKQRTQIDIQVKYTTINQMVDLIYHLHCRPHMHLLQAVLIWETLFQVEIPMTPSITQTRIIILRYISYSIIEIISVVTIFIRVSKSPSPIPCTTLLITSISIDELWMHIIDAPNSNINNVFVPETTFFNLIDMKLRCHSWDRELLNSTNNKALSTTIIYETGDKLFGTNLLNVTWISSLN